jgi:hypothetical protein
MNETKESDHGIRREGALVPLSVNQVGEAIAEAMTLSEGKPIQTSSERARETVVEAIASLEGKSIKWSEILDVMSNLAFQRGQYQLWDVMATSSHRVWETEN